MRAIVQRVSRAAVHADGDLVSEIGPGLLVLLGVGHGDTGAEAERIADQVAKLRIFADAQRQMNRSVMDIGGSVLVVSQFTLYADTSKGRRPSFVGAAPPELAEPLVAAVVDALRGMGIPTSTGVFGAHMDVELTNEGPVTVMLDTVT